MLNWWWVNLLPFKLNYLDFIFYQKLSNNYVFLSNIVIFCITISAVFSKKNKTHDMYIYFQTAGSIWWVFHNQKILNVGLFNTLSFYHPTLMFFSFFVIFIWFLNPKHILYSAFAVSLIFLLLGSWWSSQELLWQGWWNWDGVENNLLLLVVLLALFSHSNNKFYTFFEKNSVIICFIILFFIILNKTNIFKSIHSFTNSVTSGISYICFTYLICIFTYHLYKSKRSLFFYYFFCVWFFFYTNYLIFSNSIFTNLKFFFTLNLVVLLTLIVLNFKHYNLIFIFLFYDLAFSSFLFFLFYFRRRSPYFFIKLHNSFILIVCLLFYFFLQKSFFYLPYNVINSFFCKNIDFLNNMWFFFNNNSNFICDFKTKINILLKNTNKQSLFSSYDELNLNFFKNFHYSMQNLFLYYIVTEVFYLKQKPRYNYYIFMYKFKQDLLINQQKFRNIPESISKNHWALKTMFIEKQNLFLSSNQLSVDLRLYKFIFRKLKKKLLKIKTKVFVYMLPNNKTSHKSKNSRMGKGKGINNRFYFRLKKTKPIIILFNFSYTRLLKLKKYLCKFFNYRFS